MFSFLNNIPTVTRNLLIMNILMFVLTAFFESQHVDLTSMLGAHYIGTPLFEPYQIVSHFFMHGGVLHIFFNMFGLVMLGGFLERIWGPKRFFIFYVSCALGAFALYNGIGMYQLHEIKQVLATNNVDLTPYNDLILRYANDAPNPENLDMIPYLQDYIAKSTIPMVGASGAIFGILVAFAILFPNTEFLLYFAIPVKAKYLVIAYLGYEIYSALNPELGDNVAHLAHIGGAIVGAAFVLTWRKNRNHFY